MFKLSYKAGWSSQHATFGIYETRKAACQAAKLIPRKPKIWSIRVEEIECECHLDKFGISLCEIHSH